MDSCDSLNITNVVMLFRWFQCQGVTISLNIEKIFMQGFTSQWKNNAELFYFIKDLLPQIVKRLCVTKTFFLNNSHLDRELGILINTFFTLNQFKMSSLNRIFSNINMAYKLYSKKNHISKQRKNEKPYIFKSIFFINTAYQKNWYIIIKKRLKQTKKKYLLETYCTTIFQHLL